VQDTKGCALAVIPDDRRLDLDALNAEFGRRFRIAGPELARRLCPDCLPDALPPVGAAYGIETFLDEELTKRDEVLLEAGDGTRLLHVWGEDFQELFYGAWCGRFSARRRPRKRGPAPQPRALRHRSHHANSGGPTSAGVSSGIKTTGAAN
jgi:Ala-tRNA(Pro) deacylase